jgi:hypothetical protein
MTDGLSALDEISQHLSTLESRIQGGRGKLVQPTHVQPSARLAAGIYFESVRPELLAGRDRSNLAATIDSRYQLLLELASAPCVKGAYREPLASLRACLREATFDLMKARGERLVVSPTERAILDTLEKMLPRARASYEQVLRDLAQGGRVSWRGTSAELRETLREVMDHLAPDDKVTQAPGFVLEAGLTGPTQKQKVRFILKARGTRAGAVAEGSLAVDEAVASLARSAYQRGSASTHATADASEVRKLKRYVDALLAELLEIA